jgi:hypothetical protein
METAVRILEKVLKWIIGVIVAIIVIGILFMVLKANRDNQIVTLVTDVAETLVGPFRDLFDLRSREAEVAVNWGIAAVVYLLIGRLALSLARRAVVVAKSDRRR